MIKFPVAPACFTQAQAGSVVAHVETGLKFEVLEIDVFCVKMQCISPRKSLVTLLVANFTPLSWSLVSI